MEYNPRQEKEIRSNMTLPPGVYDFEIEGATEKVSKKGNDMIELSVRIFPHDGSSPRLIRDWLVAGSDLGELKINRFCHSTGIQDAYFAGELTGFTCQGVSGKCRLTVTADEKYGDQNQVKDYMPIGFDENAQEVQGVPASQTRRANKKANEELQEAATEAVGARDDQDIPF